MFTLRNEPPIDGDERVTAYINGRVTNRKNIPGQKIKGVIKEAGWQRIHPGDFAISGMNAHMGGMGVSDSLGKCSPIYLVLIPKPQINAHFISHFVRFEAEMGLIRSLIQTIRFNSADFKRNDLKSLYVWYPPIDEQKQICKVIDWINAEVNKFISIKKHQIFLLNEQKQAIIHQAVTRGLDPSVPMKPSGIEWLGEIPEHWDIIPIKRVLKRLIDTEHKTAPAIDGGKYPVIRTSNIKNGKLVFDDIYYTDEKGYSEWTRRGKPLPGELLFTREAPAGEACIIPDGIDLCMGQRVVLLGVDSQKINSEFLLLSLNSGVSKDYIKNKSVGSTVPHFNMSDIATIPILVPPLSEQLKIVQEIGLKTQSFDTIINKTNNEVLIIAEYRTRLITDVVTGKLDVRSIAATLPDVENIPLEIPTEEEPEEEFTDEEE
ncbi:MAG: restriction endonuclease subunit S [Methanomicrobiales archaeon]|nr:restriction endonuclease subunit S [Methanomicrobiales archaeon]